ncbi:MAG: hypothetical protein E7635_04140 [Ruminococcaceae bacterium]|nr:hypothetical protein [Oscillospiraceae bacterium]
MFFKKKKDSEKICSLCSYARLIDDEDKVLCTLRGVVSAEYTCKKFKYDFLKRNPGKTKKIDEFEFVDINS